MPTHRRTETSPNLSLPLPEAPPPPQGPQHGGPGVHLALQVTPWTCQISRFPFETQLHLPIASLAPPPCCQSYSSPLSKLGSHSLLFLFPVKSPLVLILCSGRHVAVILAVHAAIPHLHVFGR